jgi:hypothetical protein
MAERCVLGRRHRWILLLLLRMLMLMLMLMLLVVMMPLFILRVDLLTFH